MNMDAELVQLLHSRVLAELRHLSSILISGVLCLTQGSPHQTAVLL
jgi:hypothetical protein